MMVDKNTQKLQVMISDASFTKLNKLIAIKSIEDGTKMESISSFCRSIIESHIEEEYNKSRIENFNFKQNIDKLK